MGGAAFAVVGHLPIPRADFAAVRAAGIVYLVGGYDGSSLTERVLATRDGTTFRTVARLTPVRYPAVAAVGTKIYVLGGEWNGTASNAIQVVDTGMGRSSLIGVFPVAATKASAFTLGGDLSRGRSAAAPHRLTFCASTWPPIGSRLGFVAERVR